MVMFFCFEKSEGRRPCKLYVTFQGKMFINAFLFIGSERLLVIGLPLKWFGKSLEALERLLKLLI